MLSHHLAVTSVSLATSSFGCDVLYVLCWKITLYVKSFYMQSRQVCKHWCIVWSTSDSQWAVLCSAFLHSKAFTSLHSAPSPKCLEPLSGDLAPLLRIISDFLSDWMFSVNPGASWTSPHNLYIGVRLKQTDYGTCKKGVDQHTQIGNIDLFSSTCDFWTSQCLVGPTVCTM